MKNTLSPLLRILAVLFLVVAVFGPAHAGMMSVVELSEVQTISQDPVVIDHAAGGGPVVGVLLALVVVLLAAKIGGDIAVRLKQPEVLGELVVGVLLGNLVLFGVDAVEFLKTDQSIKVLSELGVILLLFEVGLETNLAEMRTVWFVLYLGRTYRSNRPVLLWLGALRPILLQRQTCWCTSLSGQPLLQPVLASQLES